MKKNLIIIIVVVIILWWLMNKTKETMCNIEQPVCDYYCQRAKYEVCLVKGEGSC